ncbi:hypothetical protein K461DRAFT_233974 [Myriangium duriaei CBS 260.36]|uniref:Uncharacterized protein n=1 Tax=Myriangium duriaei CBS 260.36 TaxID=1168546 RepID=A0A9P4IPC5_9PEZI|nr:hypothetical protein K461DRAFT_233974 [Myriangium duriaei CBS 260.36]
MFFTFILTLATGTFAALSDSSLVTYKNALQLTADFNPVKPAYWTSRPKHRRTPFALSPDGKSAYLAYLDNSETNVHIQQVDPSTFTAVGTPVTVTGGREAGGLVAQNDGFALLTNEVMPSGTSNAPPSNTPVPVLYRYTNGKQSWKTYLGGPSVHASDGLSMSPDLNGDLVYSEKAGLYGAYFVVTDYSGFAEGHFGDSVQYVDEKGALQTLAGASSSWGCSHNTGIAFEAADAAPFAGICAEDHGAVWLNTKTQSMDGVKISNEYVINGASNEPMGGMSGSYSSLARFQNSDAYVFAWVSRGAALLEQDTWRGDGYTTATNRTEYRRVALATFSDKNTLVGPAAISTVGATNGDAQINWVSDGPADASNARVATFDSTNALVTWEQIDAPTCSDPAMDCHGDFSGTYYQLIADGNKSGAPIRSTTSFVAGDMVTMSGGRICWPYVDMAWQLNNPVGQYSGTPAITTKQISFACMSNGDASAMNSTSSLASSATPSTSAAPTASVLPSTTIATVATSAASSVSAVSATPASSSAVSLPLGSSSAMRVPPVSSAMASSAPASSPPVTTRTSAYTTSAIKTTSLSGSLAVTNNSTIVPTMPPKVTSTEVSACKMIWKTIYV